MTVPKLNQEDINLNISMTHNEIGAAIESSPQKSPGTEDFSAEFYQTFKEELIPTLFKAVHEIEKERKLPKSLSETSTTHIPKPEKDKSKKEN
jgi:hypothetical protein